MMVRITLEDGFTWEGDPREAAFGLDDTGAHGPIVAVTSITHAAEFDDMLDDRITFPHHSRTSRSIARDAA